MTAPGSGGGWHAENQRHLAAALAEVRRALEEHAAQALAAAVPEAPPEAELSRTPPESVASQEAGVLEAPPQEAPAPPEAGLSWTPPQAVSSDTPPQAVSSNIDALAALFDLSPFERSLLLLCAGIELDATFAGLCATAQGDPGRPYPTFGLALAALPEAHWSALSPAAPLRRWRLIEVGAGREGGGLVASPLAIDERVLHYLTGVDCPDPRLEGLLSPLPAPAELPPSQRALAERAAAAWARAGRAPACPLLELGGNDAAGKRAVAAAACAALGVGLQALRAADLPAAPAERDLLARLWEREAILTGSALYLEAEEMDGAEMARGLAPFLERVQGLLVVGGREPLRALYGRSRPVLRLEVDRPGPAEQAALWRRALGTAGERLNGEVERVASQFNLGSQAIGAASAELLAQLPEGEEGAVAGPLLWEACRAQARPRLDDLAQRIAATATWQDLVLPAPQLQVLRTLAAHVRQRTRVYESWGFAAKSARGLGVSALFSGASGTGKTMAAEVLANELALDLYRIDLSAMVSKYIGETEKNLRRVFDAAEEGGAILLFDEADALFGKRSEVKDSHDRYANIEVSYLLQRVESYRGLAVLTSNLASAIDQAFLRRIRFVVQFPFPDAAQRAEIWRRVFPEATPTEGLDLAKLSRLNLSGGNIRNLAVNAAFLAADAGEPVRMRHLLAAAQAEYAKLDRPLAASEVGGWE